MKAKLGIMQSYFFPYLGYFQLIDAVDDFILYGKVSFRKKSWITRNRLLDKGTGEPFYINVPVRKQSSNRLIEEIELNNDQTWKSKLLNLLFFNYKKAPFFEEVYPYVMHLLEIEETNLHAFNAHIIKNICLKIGIDTDIHVEHNVFDDLEKQLLNASDVDYEVETKTQRIFDLCDLMKVKTYVNPIGGTDLYDKKVFEDNGYEVFFVQSSYPSYNQFHLDHVPHLSILDVLMHNGFQGTSELIKKYTLV